MKRRLLGLACVIGGFVACGSSGNAPTSGAGGGTADASPIVLHDAAARPQDAGSSDPPDVVKTPIDRMKPHDKRVLPNLKLVAVYFGEAGAEGSVSFDGFMSWIVSSDYWKTMQQYGVGLGTFVGSVRLDWHSVFAVGASPAPLIDAGELTGTVFSLLHPEAAPADDAGSDAEADAAPATSPIPRGDAYIFFLPNGVNVAFAGADGSRAQTCQDALGYHDFDGTEPYAIIAPCSLGRNWVTISHELAEMVTDPVPHAGWFSDADEKNAGGEIGDLCNNPTTVDGWSVTQLWSNADGDCEPTL